MNYHLLNLPNELLITIIQSQILDILDLINLKNTCKVFNNLVNIQKLFCRNNIKFTLKNRGNISKININSLDDYVNIVYDWLKVYNYKRGQIYMPKRIFHPCMNKNIELQFTKNTKGRCSFLITDISNVVPLYSSIQVIYEPDYTRYRLSGLNNNNKKLVLPLLLLYIGFKVLFKTHGYNYVSSFDNIDISYFDINDIDKLPIWFKKIICSQTYNGLLLNQLIDGFIEVF